MGYASPQVGYTGYTPTDDKLQEDTTTYTETTDSYVTKITGYALTDVQADSKFRFKVELRNATGARVTEMKVFIGGEEIWYTFDLTSDTFWVAKTADKAVTWKRGDLIEVKLRCDTLGGQAEMKNFEICGKISPVRLD